MEAHIDFKLAKLMKEKGFDTPMSTAYHVTSKSLVICFSARSNIEFEGKHITAPTIAETVIWLYEKHGIWIAILPELLNGIEIRYYPSVFEQGIGEDIEEYYNSPTEAYTAAIEYCLTKLL